MCINRSEEMQVVHTITQKLTLSARPSTCLRFAVDNIPTSCRQRDVTQMRAKPSRGHSIIPAGGDVLSYNKLIRIFSWWSSAMSSVILFVTTVNREQYCHTVRKLARPGSRLLGYRAGIIWSYTSRTSAQVFIAPSTRTRFQLTGI